MTNVNPISLDRVKSYPLRERKSKVTIDDFGKPWRFGGDMGLWVRSLPKILAGNDSRVEEYLQFRQNPPGIQIALENAMPVRSFLQIHDVDRAFKVVLSEVHR